MKLIGSHNRWTLCLLRRKNYYFLSSAAEVCNPFFMICFRRFFGRVTRRKIEWTDVTSDSQVVMAPLFGMKILSSSSTSSTKIFSPFLWCGKKIVFSAVLPMSNIQWNSSLDFIRLFLVIWIGWWKSILSWSPTKDRNVKCSYFGGGMYLLKWDLHNCLKVVSYPFIIQILQCSMPENGNLVIYLLRKMILLFSLII